MTILTSGTFTSGFSWDQRTKENSDLNSVIDSGQTTKTVTYPTGTGGNTYDAIWHDIINVASGQSGEYNAQALSGTYLGTTITKNFNKVKVFSLCNNATVSGEDLLLSFPTGGLDEPFGYPTGSIRIGAGAAIGQSDLYDGWDVDVNNKGFTILNNGTGTIEYEIAIAGNTG